MQYVVLGLQICVGVKSITNLFCVACTKIEFKSEHCLTHYYKFFGNVYILQKFVIYV